MILKIFHYRIFFVNFIENCFSNKNVYLWRVGMRVTYILKSDIFPYSIYHCSIHFSLNISEIFHMYRSMPVHYTLIKSLFITEPTLFVQIYRVHNVYPLLNHPSNIAPCNHLSSRYLLSLITRPCMTNQAMTDKGGYQNVSIKHTTQIITQ